MFKKTMFKKTLIAAIALTLTAGAVHADEKLSKPQGAGMLTGAAAGAVVGGPIGAFVGLMIGGIVGDSVGQAQRADRRAQSIEEELLQTRRELAQVSQRENDDVMFAALAQSMRSQVLFKTGSVILDVPTQDQLAQLGKLLAAHPDLAIQLHGFADPRGGSPQNLELSRQRAGMVREALLFGGATPEQIELSAHGEELTTAAKNDIEAYAWERRVSLVIQPSSSKVAQSR
jgi:outer membrane protein OmpA-like peptidoglycan-associated protein